MKRLSEGERASGADRSRNHGNAPVITELATLFLRAFEVVLIVGLGAALVAARGDAISTAMAVDHYRVAALGALLYAGLAAASGSYDIDILYSGRRSWSYLARTWGAAGMFLLGLGFVLKASADISREWALLWYVSVGVLLWISRLALSVWLKVKKRQGWFDVPTAVFGAGAQAAQLIDYVASNDQLTLKIVGIYDDRHGRRDDDPDNALPVLGNLKDLIDAIRRGGVDQVIVALPWSASQRIQEVVQHLALTPVRIRLAPDLVGFAFKQKPFALLGEVPVMTLFDRPISGLDQIVKWLEDQILALLFLAVLSPLLIVTAAAIKIESRGPVFFRQPREGFNGYVFRIWKFRSMRAEDSQTDAIVQARQGDDRVTRVGAFIRRTSIDELPQLFNVIAGDMSLVGPRPHAPSTKAGQRLFKEVVSTYAARHRVKPGITGWAQVKGWRGPTDTESKLVGRLEHDLHYIDNWSPLFDLYILARTVSAALFPRNAF